MVPEMSPALDITSPRALRQRLAFALLASLMLHGIVLNVLDLRMPLIAEVRATGALLVSLTLRGQESTPVVAPSPPAPNAEAPASRSRQARAQVRGAAGIAAPAAQELARSAPALLLVSVSDEVEPQPLPAPDPAGIDLQEYVPAAALDEHPVPQRPIMPEDPRKIRGEKFRYRVYFLVLLDESGRVDRALAVEPDVARMNLVEAARAALLEARFSVPRVGGRKVKARLFLSVHFTHE